MLPPEYRAFVAQWLEHWSCKPGVESSNLSEGFCPMSVYYVAFRFLTQSVEHQTLNLRVVGSSPTLGEAFLNYDCSRLRVTRSNRSCLLKALGEI